MKCDIYEKDGNYNVVMDIPGFSKDDIKIECDNGIITISCERNEESNEDLYAAIDKIVDKLERQIRKNKEKINSKINKTFIQDFEYDLEDEYEEDTPAFYSSTDVPKYF